MKPGNDAGAQGGHLPCPHYPRCVGCALIGTPYGAQLDIKRRRVQSALGGFPTLAALEIPRVVGSPQAFGYRNQAKLVARHARTGLLLGIYKPGSHQVVDIRQCPVHHPLIAAVLDAVATAVERLGLSVHDERTHAGLLRYVVVRVSRWSRQAQVILVTYQRALPDARELVRALLRVKGVISVVQNVNAEPGNVIFGREFVPLTRETALIERVGVLKLKTHAGAFVQANVAVARKVYEQALAWAIPDGADTVVDLYCGVGALTFHLATRARLAIGIEDSPIAVRDAKENIRLNGFHNVRFFCGDAGPLLTAQRPSLANLDVLTLNPPRKGASAEARAAIVACRPQRIVYVSCDPDTLARDLDWFGGHGYRTTRVQPFDLLPQTDHVESVALLEG